MGDEDAKPSFWASVVPDVHYDLIARIPAGTFLAVALVLFATNDSYTLRTTLTSKETNSWFYVLLIGAGYSFGMLLSPLGEGINWIYYSWAWKEVVKDKQLGSPDGFTPEQRFFIGFAQWACSNERPEHSRVLAVSDPHAPAQYRVNGVVVNMPPPTRQ